MGINLGSLHEDVGIGLFEFPLSSTNSGFSIATTIPETPFCNRSLGKDVVLATSAFIAPHSALRLFVGVH